MFRMMMRQTAAALFPLLLLACSGQPDVKDVEREATSKLQSLIDTRFGSGKATVDSMELVSTSDRQFSGQVKITSGNTNFDLPVVVTSDGTTTIVSADDEKISQGLQRASIAEIAKLTDKYATEILEPSLLVRMPKALQEDKAKFKNRLEVVVPIEKVDGGYFGSGCKTHLCGVDEAAWYLSEDGSMSAAIVMETREQMNPDGSPTFYIYGATAENLPRPLATWANDHGLSGMNSVVMRPKERSDEKEVRGKLSGAKMN